MIIYVGDGDFTPETIPAKYPREDALREPSFSDVRARPGNPPGPVRCA
ncbi:hypothetical protein [Methanoregula sp.]